MSRSSLCCAVLVASLTMAAATSARADDFLQQPGDMWRASKLVGVNIYGPDKKKVGGISDLLMSKDGKIGYVVVGVGGFLGIGEKDVAIPYGKVTFTDEPIAPPAVPAGNNMAATGTAPANTGMSPNATTNGAGTGATPMAANNAAPAATPTAAPPAGPKMYPDHGTVEYTVDQLKAAPTFTYTK